MANVLTSKIRIRVNTSGDEPAIFILKRPSAEQVQRFLKARTELRRNKVVNRAYEARAEFIDSLLLDVENIHYESASGEVKPLNAQVDLADVHEGVRHDARSWKDLVPMNWKASAAMFFEEADDAEEGEKNF